MENKNYLFNIIIIVVLCSILVVLWYLIISTNNNSNVGSNMPSINNTSSASYSSVKEITSSEDIDGESYSSSNKDENAISVSGGVTSNLSNISVDKTGDSDGGDNTSFYGTNSAIIAKNGATLNISDASITTNAT